MIEAVIFDMDGVIIDSEPFWREAQLKVYKSLGLEMTEEMCAVTTGLGTYEAVLYWYKIMPWSGSESIKEVCDAIETEVSNIVKARGVPNIGILELIDRLKNANFKIGLASSSPMHLINAVLDTLKIKHLFEVYHSSEFEEACKPHPGVYLGAAKLLGVNPSKCLAVEDSITGMKAGLAAGMYVAVLPNSMFLDNLEYNKAHVRLNSLHELEVERINKLMDFQKN